MTVFLAGDVCSSVVLPTCPKFNTTEALSSSYLQVLACCVGAECQLCNRAMWVYLPAMVSPRQAFFYFCYLF